MSSSEIPLDQIAAYAEVFRQTLCDLSAADNRVAAAANTADDARRRQEETERDRVRQALAELADRLAEGGARLGVGDTTALTAFRQTWGNQDLLRALDLVNVIAAKALLATGNGDPLAVAERALHCLDDLQGVEEEWWRLEISPPPPPFQPELDERGLSTKAHAERYRLFTMERAARKEELVRLRDELRKELKDLGNPLMALAVRPEINLQPSRLRNLLLGWGRHAPSHPDRVHEARNFLADLALKLRDPAVAAALAAPGEAAEAAARPPLFIHAIPPRYRWDELHPLVRYASLTAAEGLYHMLLAFERVVRGVPPDEYLPYGNGGHYYTFAQLDALGHRFIVCRIMFERVQKELTQAHLTRQGAVLPEAWGVRATSAHDLAVRVLQGASQLMMGWAPGTPGEMFARRWEELRRALERFGDLDGREVVDAMWAEAAYADEKYRAELNAPTKLSAALLDLLTHERNETRRLEAPEFNEGGLVLNVVGDEPPVVQPTPRAQASAERMRAEASDARRQIQAELRDRVRATASAVAEKLARPARAHGIVNWHAVLRYVNDWQAADAAPALAIVRDLKALGPEDLPSGRGGNGEGRRPRTPPKVAGAASKARRASIGAASTKGTQSDGPRWVEGDVYAVLEAGRKIRQKCDGKTPECELSALHFKICEYFLRRESASVRDLMNPLGTHAPWKRQYTKGRGDNCINTAIYRLSVLLAGKGLRVEFTRKGQNVLRSLR